MHSKPDFASWSVTELLSIHEIACLSVGAAPTPQNGGKFVPPSVPDGLHENIDQSDLDQEYWNIVRLLQRALEAKVIEPTTSGKIAPKNAVAYLEQAAKYLKDDWVEKCEFTRRVKSLEPISKETDILHSKISELESDLARYKARTTYSTPMLELANKVIDEFYAGQTSFPKQETVFAFLRVQKINNRALSQKQIDSVWAVASSPYHKKSE